MIPGPDQVIACPHCGALERHITLVSGNTFGARLWSDGKSEAPMLPTPPKVVRCHQCRDFFWLADAKKLGKVGGWNSKPSDSDPAWASARGVVEPTEAQYYQALKAGLAKNREQTKTLRILAWWRRNDRSRHGESAAAASPRPMTRAARDNLRSLFELLDGAHEDDKIMKAEVLRELGDFEAAAAVLATIASEGYAGIVRQLQSLCAHKNADLQELSRDDR